VRPGILAAALATGLVLTGCAPIGGSLGLDAVAAERADRAEARVDALLASYAEYLTDRWPGILLPETTVEAWLGPGVWTTAFQNCASEAAGRDVVVDVDAGITTSPPPRTAGELRDVETAIYLCQGRLPPPGLGASDPGPIEIAWVTAYARDALPTCLRREGVAAEPLPDDPFAILSGGATPGWDPYRAARGDAPALRRLQALCPHPSVLLSTISPVGEPVGEPIGEPIGEPAAEDGS
jgi:hypothetical protein